MSTALKQNSDFQATSLDWLGQFPSRWSVEPGLAVLQERQVKNIGLVEPTVLSLSYGRVVIKPQDKLRGLVPESFETYQIVEPGNIIIRPTDLQNDHVSLRVGQAKDRGIITSAYMCLETKGKLTEDFAHLLLHAYDIKKVFYGLGSGLRQNLSWVDFRRLPIPVPPTEEQAQIVRFIRHLDQRVNRLIKTKRRLIELLNEQKQAIIHRAVTRGLDPTVPLKPSGIEWLGDVPSHWKVMGLRLRYSVELGKMLDAKRISGDHLIPYLRNTDVQWDNVRSANLPEMDIRPDEYERYTVRRGDLLVCEGGEVGRAAMWSQTERVVGFQKALHRLRPRCADADNPRFLMYVLFYVAKKGVFKADGSENTIAHLTSEKLRKYRFAFPERAEQDMLVEHIDQESSDINLVIEKTQSEIDFIREYRTRLVADVVTGQLDVRHLDLPEVEESLIEAIDSLAEELEDPEETVVESDG